MSSQEIRSKFLQYFKDRGHAHIASAPVVPHDDPTLLFNNSGMSQFKDVFLGKSLRDYKTATTSQKCIRVGGKHNDLDNVGHTSRHLTFFEMLGNFSFGDYFKEQAIQYAWEVSREIFGFSKDKIWVTVFETDDEAFSLWEKYVDPSRIVRMGEKDNFWAMGETGPCGPCSELLYDRGSDFGSARNPKEDASGERFFEFWNLVFMQYNRDQNGKFSPLPNKCIDTGAGLERVVSLKQNVTSVYATDILRSLIAQVETISGKSYNPNNEEAAAFHVIADHIRSLSFAIADGVQPSNLDRGYVLRKLLRRAVRYGRLLGLQEPFLAKVFPRLIETMGQNYKELVIAKSRIEEILTLEEEAFIRTLKRGGNLLQQVIEKAFKHPSKEITGEEAFKLKDTYGFPLEEILLLAKDASLTVNLESYQILEEQAKNRSRSSQQLQSQEAGKENLYKDFAESHPPCAFTGYEHKEEEAKIIGLISDGKKTDMLSLGETGEVILDRTPFYAEKGGQVGDVGTLSHQNATFSVFQTQAPYNGIITHCGKVEKGTLKVGDKVLAKIDFERRKQIAANHSATHLLHLALQKIIGAHIKQAGSLVEAARLRFDFTHHKALTPNEIREIEEHVNASIRENSHVKTYEISYEEAQKKSEIKQFFGDKYGSIVRVIEMGESQELCGGTHIDELGKIGFFRITKESSIGAGIRRIEAVTGKAAEEFCYKNEDLLQQAASQLKASSHNLIETIQGTEEERVQLQKMIKVYKTDLLSYKANEIASLGKIEKGVFLISSVAPLGSSVEDLTMLADAILKKHKSAAILLGSEMADKCMLLIKLSSDLVAKGLKAQELIKEIAPFIGGSGGGKPDSAQAGGKNKEGLLKALKTFEEIIFARC